MQMPEVPKNGPRADCSSSAMLGTARPARVTSPGVRVVPGRDGVPEHVKEAIA